MSRYSIHWNTQTRGLCPVCGRITFLRRKDGAVGYHGTSDRGQQPPCTGWGCPPQENYVNPDIAIITQTIRDFDYDDYGLHMSDVNGTDYEGKYFHEWPPDLAEKIAEALRRGAP